MFSFLNSRGSVWLGASASVSLPASQTLGPRLNFADIDWIDYCLYCQLIYVCYCLKVRTALWVSVSLSGCILSLVWPVTICIHCIIWVLEYLLIYICYCLRVGTGLWVNVPFSSYILMLDWQGAVRTDHLWLMALPVAVYVDRQYIELLGMSFPNLQDQTLHMYGTETNGNFYNGSTVEQIWIN